MTRERSTPPRECQLQALSCGIAGLAELSINADALVTHDRDFGNMQGMRILG